MLKFSFHNSKLHTLAKWLKLKLAQVVCFDIVAGFSCVKASICKTFADEITGKLTKVGRVVCFASRGETFAPSVRRLRWGNYRALLECGKDIDKIYNLILSHIPDKVKIIRIHSSGDFYSFEYFMAWLKVAQTRTDITIFGYTKVLDYAIKVIQDLPVNFFVNYSYGSLDDERFDNLDMYVPVAYIEEYPGQYPGLKRVCATHELGYEDFVCITNRESFCLPIH